MDWVSGTNQPMALEFEISQNIIFKREHADDDLLPPTEPTTIYVLKAIKPEPEFIIPDRIDPLVEPQVSSTLCDQSPEQDESDNKVAVKHENELAYQCIVCSASFRQSIHLKNHLITHTDKKPFKCRVCGNKFTQKSSLTLHMKQHSEEKPFKCTYCDKRFRLKLYVQCHERTHTGERPYACYECGSAFTQKSALNTHLKSHLVERPFKCPECPAEFKLATYLKSHCKLKHSGEDAGDVKRRRFAPREGIPVFATAEEDVLSAN